MPKVTFGGQSYNCGDGQSVLDCLTAHGVPVPSSCRSGVCQTCMMQAIRGDIPDKAQTGIKPTLASQNYFLACSCYPEQDIEVALPQDSLAKFSAEISGVERLSDDILGIRIRTTEPFAYRAGQFINLFMDEQTSRSYSLASVPDLDDDLFLHVRRVPGGLVSNWMFEHLNSGDPVTISAAIGDCFYVPGKPEQHIMLIGTGSGLAPLYGIVRDALRNGHQGKIRLYHGSYDVRGLYLINELIGLEKEYENFSYIPCLSGENPHEGYAQGMVLDVALSENPDLAGWRIFLCGNPDMVKSAKTKTFLAGAATRDILADPFN